MGVISVSVGMGGISGSCGMDAIREGFRKKQGPSGTKHGLEVNLQDKNQVRPSIIPSP